MLLFVVQDELADAKSHLVDAVRPFDCEPFAHAAICSYSRHYLQGQISYTVSNRAKPYQLACWVFVVNLQDMFNQFELLDITSCCID